MRKITDNLYIGGLKAPEKTEDIEMDRIVSLDTETGMTTDGYIMEDGIQDYKKFTKAVDTVENALENDEKVLVHCQRGRSRSVTVGALGLYGTEDELTLYECLDQCKLAEDEPPNREMLISLMKYVDNESVEI
jgi:protein-tyrosine phosphatase